MKTVLTFLIFLLLLFLNFSYAQNNSLRVGILIQVEKCNLRVRGRYQIQLPYTHQILIQGKNLKTEVRIAQDSINLASKKFKVFGVDILAQRDGQIYLNSRPYRGKIRLLNDKGKLTVVNIVSIEDYLKGVLNYEVAHWWPIQALMAQAVASRSYALYMKKVNKDKFYDLRADTFSQIYGGRRGERWRVKRAIRKTRGLILVYKGEILPAFYHSTCGGHTDSGKHLWNIDLPPLKGVPCNFCRFSPHYRWKKKISITYLKNVFNQAGYNFDKIQNIKVKERYDTGYVKQVEIIADGKSYLISAKEFRSILGVNLLRSRRFLLELKKNWLYITGYGWGHGVGLCQWGAYGMALKGYNFRQILNYYYPGAKIRKIIWNESQN